MNQSSRRLYEHRQVGWVMILGALVPFVCLAGIVTVAPPGERALPPFLLPILCGVSGVLLAGFSSLATIVTETDVVLRFGIGIYQRAIPLDRISHVSVAESRWYEGWGIRWTRRGMLYNVAGFETVRIDLVDGRSLRIGSDEAGRFRHAISHAIRDRNGPRAAP